MPPLARREIYAFILNTAKCVQFISPKIVKFVATICHILKQKCIALDLG